VGHAIDGFTVLHPSAWEDVMAGHEAQCGAALGEQYLRLALAPHEDAGGRNSWFGRHCLWFLLSSEPAKF
jgi:hypothetical protein